MKPIILLLMLPFFARAQNSEPVNQIISKDYMDLIRQNAAAEKNVFVIDSTNSFRSSKLALQKFFSPGIPIKKIQVTASSIRVHHNAARYLKIGGDISSVVEFRAANRQPALQTEYVQGRSQNGVVTWRGPETDEWFSFGLTVHSQEFDGSNYPYDINGKLTATGAGNGVPAKSYNNSILRTSVYNSQSLSLRATLYERNVRSWTFNFQGGKSNEQIFIKNNKNSSGIFSVSGGKIIRGMEITGNYSFLQNKFSNSNRNGFLNTVYQYSLLTPVSFSNSQSTTFANGDERRFSSVADNPLFLLENNGNHFTQTQQSGRITVEKNNSEIRFKIIQSLEGFRENSGEGFKTGAVNFPNGFYTERNKKDRNYYLKGNAWYTVDYRRFYRLSSALSVNYILAAVRSTTHYSHDNKFYQYKRVSHDYSLSYLTTYDGRFFRTGIDLGNKFYISNTTRRDNFFLPAAGAFIRFDNVAGYFSFKLSSAFNRFNSELPIEKSLSCVNLLRYSVRDARRFLPVQEAAGHKNLSPISHRELSGTIEISYKNRVMLTAELFRKTTKNDVFPVFSNGDLILKNIANHRRKGMELQLSTYQLSDHSRKFHISNNLAFVKWRNKVTGVQEGYNFTPIAGFSDINKVIVQGESFGVIAGSSYAEDVNGNIIIGADGFPLMSGQPKIIGDPTPDFIIKQGNTFTYKKLSVSINLEWRKGGDVWNGTQASLDYYGRSQNSAALRNITSFVFTGVLEDGQVNKNPVSFYDPALPVNQNRWVRYGLTGIAEEYIRKGDNLRFNNIALAYQFRFRKTIQQLTISAYINNLVIWSAYKGSDPGQLLYDQPNTEGLDYFNLPSTKTFGFNLSIQL
ncbi:MAG TPA: hypothetical protein VI461_09465 [Chitinophagaceae bacterium]|nr:hypothetical protein [Chitinophagaceae bacterium]